MLSDLALFIFYIVSAYHEAEIVENLLGHGLLDRVIVHLSRLLANFLNLFSGQAPRFNYRFRLLKVMVYWVVDHGRLIFKYGIIKASNAVVVATPVIADVYGRH